MQTHPNIVIFVSDDQGAWALGCAGNNELKTPNIDRIAANGVRFENFFCVSPVCSPARASLLTGRIPSDHGIQDWLRKGNIDDRPFIHARGSALLIDPRTDSHLLVATGKQAGGKEQEHIK